MSATTEKTEEKKKRPTRPRNQDVLNTEARTKPIQKIDSWAQWLEVWNSTTQVGSLLGLLHRVWGQRVQCSWIEDRERLLFLLRWADGHEEGSFYFKGEDNPPYSYTLDQTATPDKLREALSIKAFSVLCTNFFSLPRDDWFSYLSFDGEITDKVLDTLVWFLRVTAEDCRNKRYKIRNAPRGSTGFEATVFERFAKDFTELFWDWRTKRVDSLEEYTMVSSGIRVRLERRQHRVIPTMILLGNLERILPYQYQADTNPIVLRLLRMIIKILYPDLPSVEMAAFKNSIPASVLLRLRNNVTQRQELARLQSGT